MRVAITGVAGFIGSHLAAHLLARGDSVVGLDCFDESLYPAAAHEDYLRPLIAHAQFAFQRGDILDEFLVARIFADCDVVVHLAGLAGVRLSMTYPERFERTNVQGTEAMLRVTERLGIAHFVLASSSSIYGATTRVPTGEDHDADGGISPYARSKRGAELACLRANVRTTILRFFTVYGPRQRPDMGIQRFGRAILAGEALTAFGDGTSARDYTYVSDIVDGITAAIDRPPQSHAIYNLGGGRTTTLAQLIALLEAGLGRRAQLSHIGDQAGDVPITFADISRASAQLDYTPKVSIERGIALFCEWLKQLK